MKINVHLGFTVRANDEGEFIKPAIDLIDIDLDQDVDAQLEQAKASIDKAWKVCLEMLLVQTKKLLKERKGG